MADYCCAIRTNYFHVKDKEKFMNFMQHVRGTEDSIEVWTDVDSKGNTVYAFGCYGTIDGYVSNLDDDEEEPDIIAFEMGLTDHIADDDAIMIFESGHEKLRYVIGGVLIITSTGSEYHDIREIGINSARTLLGNESWSSECEY